MDRLDRRIKRFRHYENELEDGRFPIGLRFHLAKRFVKFIGMSGIGLMMLGTSLISSNYLLPGKCHNWLTRSLFSSCYENSEKIEDISRIPLVEKIIGSELAISRIPEELELIHSSAKILSSDDTLIKEFGKRQYRPDFPDDAKLAVILSEDEYLLRHENRQFWPPHRSNLRVHGGVDLLAIPSAMIQGRGASTIPMQLAKQYLDNQQRNNANKIEEMIIASEMVDKYGKGRLLVNYMNTVPLPNNVYGLQKGAETFFGRSVEELDWQQLLTLCAFKPSPNIRWSGIEEILEGKNLDELTTHQRSAVLDTFRQVNGRLKKLLDLDEITDEEYERFVVGIRKKGQAFAIDEPAIRSMGLKYVSRPLQRFGTEEWSASGSVNEICKRRFRLHDGRTYDISGKDLLLGYHDVVIRTSVDLDLQRFIKEMVEDFIGSGYYDEILRKRNEQNRYSIDWTDDMRHYLRDGRKPPYDNFESFISYMKEQLNVGVIVAKDGDARRQIVAYVPSKEFLKGSGIPSIERYYDFPEGTRGDEIRIEALGPRSRIYPGSMMKPLIYYSAIDLGIAEPETLFRDAYLKIECRLDRCKPDNWDGRPTGGYFSLLDSLVFSKNTVFARLYYDNRSIGNQLQSIFEKAGISYSKDDIRYWPFSIGATSLPAWEFMQLHASFMDGLYKPLTFIDSITIDKDHTEIIEQPPGKILNDDARELTLEALAEVGDRGSASAMESVFPYFKGLVRMKTGTESEQRESGVVGMFSPYSDFRDTYIMMVRFNTYSGGFKRVGYSTEGPVQVCGKICRYIFEKEFRQGYEDRISKVDDELRKAEIMVMMRYLLDGEYAGEEISDHIIGVDGYMQILDDMIAGRIKEKEDLHQLLDYRMAEDIFSTAE